MLLVSCSKSGKVLSHVFIQYGVFIGNLESDFLHSDSSFCFIIITAHKICI